MTVEVMTHAWRGPSRPSAIGRRVPWACDDPRGPRDPGPSAYLQFSFFVFPLLDPISKGAPMRRINLVAKTLECWARLSPAQRDRAKPLAAPIDPARFAISEADIALLMRAARSIDLRQRR